VSAKKDKAIVEWLMSKDTFEVDFDASRTLIGETLNPKLYEYSSKVESKSYELGI
jgi:hypothetical protein